MRFSAKGEYGVMAILELALSSGQGPVQVRNIAVRQGIPVRFLEQVMSTLKKAGLVESIRGAQGGYILSRPSTEISLAQVLEAIDGPIRPMDCVSGEKTSLCHQAKDCVVKDVWEEVKVSIAGVLNSITLNDMCERKRKKLNLPHIV